MAKQKKKPMPKQPFVRVPGGQARIIPSVKPGAGSPGIYGKHPPVEDSAKKEPGSLPHLGKDI